MSKCKSCSGKGTILIPDAAQCEERYRMCSDCNGSGFQKETMNVPAKKYQYLDHEPEMICLIGSSRFKELHFKVMREETLKGNIVLLMGLFGHNEGLDMDGPIKKMLDELHLVKIDHSSIVIVCNEMVPYCLECHEHRMQTMGCTGQHSWQGYFRPYVGESTRREIDYAHSQGKMICFVNPPDVSVHADTYFNKQGAETGRFQSQEPNQLTISKRCWTCEGRGTVVWRDGVAGSSFDKSPEDCEPCPTCRPKK